MSSSAISRQLGQINNNEEQSQAIPANLSSIPAEYLKTSDLKSYKLPVVEYSWLQTIFRRAVGTLLFPVWTFSRFTLIKDDEVGLLMNNGKAELLGPGWHMLLSPTSTLNGIRKVSEKVIEHGTIKLINVRKGELALMEDQGKQCFLTEGPHIINSRTKVFKKIINLNNPIPDNSNDLQIVRIETGKVGIVSRSGVLEALPSGIHLIVPPDKLLSSISVQQEILPLGNRPYRSYDNFPLNINADVFYTITDPGKAVSFVRDIIKYITDTSIATLNGILQHSTIGDIGKSAVPAYRAANENASISLSSEAISAPDINDSLYSRVHDGFIVELNKDLQLHGIEINNIRIESLTISDPKLSENISAQALITAQTATTLANIDSQTRIKVAEARREADVACIEAGMKANNEKIAADAAAAVLATQAKAQAAAIITEATAQAEATKLQAEADKIRRRCEADADSGYANAIGSTRVGVTLELAKLQAKTMTGVSKTIYLPNESVSALANFNMFTRVLNDNHQDSVSSTVQSSEHSSLGNSLVSS